ncbi:kinesin-like protein KIF19 isoform X2 [Lissotriton helveticus]
MKDHRGGPRAQQLTVALRIRPMNEAEIDDEASFVAHKLAKQTVVLLDPTEDPDDILRANRTREKTFVFDMVFDEKATQEEVYVSTTKTLIDGVIAGYNATVFAYGPTGTGKTYTMLGMDSEPGIYIQTLNNLFKSIEATSDNIIYAVSMSYLEIYNELIRDLLNPSSGYLELREDSRGNIQIAGITEVSTNNAQKIIQLLTKGNKQRTQEPTAANKTSSRSHAVLQVKVKQKCKVKENNEDVRVGRLFMIDLAGSERASQTQNKGKRLKEGAHINRSLLALGNCITALSEKGGIRAHFVNFRDSKLTRLLKDSLEGNSKTVMIAHISPASTSFEESRTTLIYAYRAKNIKTRVVNRNLQNANFHIAQYNRIIAELRKEIQRLKGKDEQHEKMKESKLDIRDIQEVKQSTELYNRQEMDKLREQLVSAFKEEMQMRRSLLELENIILELRIETSRHLLTIADWENVKAQRSSAFQKRDSMHSHGGVDEEEVYDLTEPQEIFLARQEYSMLLNEQQKTSELKCELKQRLANAKLKVSQLKENLPNVISNDDQQEVLRLLCKIHELEVENTELQAGSMWKENHLCQKDIVLGRYQQHRSMCEEIIRQQLILIEDHDIPIPQHLGNLYRLYFQEFNAGTLNRLVKLHSFASETYKERMNASEQLKGGASFLQANTVNNPDNTQDENQTDEEKVPELPPIIFDSDRDSPRTSKSSASLKHDSSFSPIAFHLMGPYSSQQRQTVTALSLKDIISILRSPTSLGSDSRQSVAENPGSTLNPEALEEITVGTKHISLIAARRRSQVHVPGSSQALDREKASTRLSTNLFDDMEETRYLKNTYSPHHRMEGASSIESLHKEPEKDDGNITDHPLLKIMDDLRMQRLRHMHARKKSSKKRSQSYETVSPKDKSKNMPVRKMDSVSDLRLPKPTQPMKIFLRSTAMSNLSHSTPSATKVKFPVSKVDSQLQVLKITGTPPSTIHQSNNAQNRGHVLHKQVKVPSERVNTRLTQAPTGILKQRPSANTWPSMSTRPSLNARPSMSSEIHVKHEAGKRNACQ